jgi:hypothetical protein
MTLQDWQRSNWIVAHSTTSREIRGLLSVADRELGDAQVKGLSVDARFTHAYGAALQCSLAALAAAGYRVAKGVSHHHYALQSLTHTLNCEAGLIAKLDKLRKKRNISDYEQAGAISDQEAAEMVKIAKSLRTEVEAWLRENHSKLLERSSDFPSDSETAGGRG